MLPEGSCKVIRFKGKEVGLFHHQKKIYAIDNLCPHRQAPLVAGKIENGIVVCPWHAAQFDLATGKGLPGSHRADLCAYNVKVEGADVMIGVRE